MPLPSRYELEPQIFGLIKIIGSLQNKVKSGDITLSFYRKAIGTKIHDFLLLELILKEKNLVLDEVIKDMKISDEFQNTIQRFKEVSLFDEIEIEKQIESSTDGEILKLKSADEEEPENNKPISTRLLEKSIVKSGIKDQNWKKVVLIKGKTVNPIHLAKISSEITSDFITLLDYFQLEMHDYEIFNEIAKKLSDRLKLFPGMEELAIDVALNIPNKEKYEDKDKFELKTEFEHFYYRFKKFFASASK